MRRNSYQSEDYDLQLSHEYQRRLEIQEEQEPRWMHYRPRPKKRRPRYFSGLMFRPAPATEPDPVVASEETDIALAS